MIHAHGNVTPLTEQGAWLVKTINRKKFIHQKGETIMWKLKLKTGLWDLELTFDDIEDAATYINTTVEHTDTEITFTLTKAGDLNV